MSESIKVTLVKSGIGRKKKIRETLKGLGLTKMNKTVEVKNTPAMRGMIAKEFCPLISAMQMSNMPCSPPPLPRCFIQPLWSTTI